jgi:hypothetical protein
VSPHPSRIATALALWATLVAAPAQAAGPDAFTFIERTGVATGAVITSEKRTVTGFDGPLTISVSGGSNAQYRIDQGGYTSTPGSISAGQTLTVRHTSAGSAQTASTTTVTVGGYSTTFRSVTGATDRTPDAFDFGSRAGVEPGTAVESDPVTLTGYNTGIAIAPGPNVEYRIDGGAFTTAGGTLQPGQALVVRHTSAGYLQYARSYLKVGGVIGYFTTRTRAETLPADADGDGVPDASDACPATPAGEAVDASGCGATQRDGDGDGVVDAYDQCPDTAPGQAVMFNGCPVPLPPLAIRVLSSVARAPILASDGLVSGDDALVEVVLPEGAANPTMRLNGADVTAQFALRANGRVMAQLAGLAIGDNTLSAQADGAAPTTITIQNFPNGGPIFSGPQVQPWRCTNGTSDPQCNKPAEYRLLYKSTDGTLEGLQPYDPANPPDDLATTTTEKGQTLPFIVQQERGWQARDEYKILQLVQLDAQGKVLPWQPWAPQAQWNHKVLITHGGSCGTDHGTGSAPLGDYAGTIPANPIIEQSYIVALGRGYAVMSTALDNLGHNCNLVTAAESLMMAKERLIEQYGEVRYTIGTGCSGGAITQQHVANAYPGIYDGLITTCAYPDALSTGAQFADLHLMRGYFENPSKWAPGVVWSPQQFGDVEGHASHLNAVTTSELFFQSVTDPSNCDGGVPAPQRYHRELNPTGVRCGLMDYMVNVLGQRPPEVWSPMEIAAGRGFGGFFAANDGIEYGLKALRAGRITPAQFVDLNAKIGGVDIDFKPVPGRLKGDVASIEAAYLSGGVNSTNNMDQVAIINSAGPDPGAAHDTVHAWWTRWRLDREQGHHDNHVMWTGPVALIGDPHYLVQSLHAMNRWLAAVEADTSDTPRAQKIVLNKPADIHDQCSDGAGHKLLDEVCPEAIQGRFTSPRQEAGGPITDDVMKCRLKPLRRADHTFVVAGVDTGVEIPFTDAEWAQLEAVFAEGVCDYTLPGVGQQGTVPWRDYSDAPVVTYSGTYTPAPPPQRPYPTCEPFGNNCIDDIPVVGGMVEDAIGEVYDATLGGTQPPGELPGGGTLPNQCEPFSGNGYCLSDIPGIGYLFK